MASLSYTFVFSPYRQPLYPGYTILSIDEATHCLCKYGKYYVMDNKNNRIGGVIVSVLGSSVVDRGFELRSDQTTDYKIGICCFCAKHAASLRRKSKDWLSRNQDNLSEWGDMSNRELLFQ